MALAPAPLPPGFRVVSPAAPPAMPQPVQTGTPQAPRVGAPILTVPPKAAPAPTPFDVEDQNIQRENARRAQLEWNATHNPDGTPKASAKTPEQTAAERKAEGFVIRAQGANQNFGQVEDIGARSVVGQTFANNAPNVLNSLPAFIGNSEDRQLSDQAQKEFIAAVLRLDSGAAIPPEEFVTNSQIYFPQPGDGKKVLQQKAGARLRAINSLRVQAGMEPLPDPEPGKQDGANGAAAGVVPPTLGSDGGVPGGASAGVREPTQRDIYGNGVEFGMDRWGQDNSFDRGRYIQERYGVTENQEDLATGFWNANSGNANLTVENAREWYQGRGMAPPSPADLERGVRDARAGKRFGGINTSAGEAEQNAALDAILEQRGADPESISGTIGAKGAQGLMLGGLDEMSGVAGGISAAIRGQSPVAGYQVERDAIRREQERAEAANPKTAIVTELIAGLPTAGIGFAKAGRYGRLATQAAKIGDTARATSLASQGVRSAARSGGVAGAVTGFNYGEGPAGSLGGATVGATAGAGLSAVAQKYGSAVIEGVGNAARKFLPQRAGPSAEQAGLIGAAERMKVPLRQPDVRPELRGDFAAAEQSKSGGPMIRDAIQTDRDAIEQGVRGVSPGQARDEFALGGTTQGAAERTRTSMKNVRTAAYTQARNLAGDARVDPVGTMAAIDSKIATLTAAGEGANASEIKILQGIREDLTKTGLTIDSLQAQRKGLRNRLTVAGLDPDRAQAEFMDVLTTAGKELESGLAANPATKRAAAALSRANRAHQEYVEFRDKIAREFLGTRNSPIRPELAASRFMSMVKNKGDYNRFSRMFGELEQAERDDFAATIAEGLGTKANGEFEYGKFLRDIDGMNPRAIRDLFGDTGVSALNDLRAIANAKSDTLAERNVSRSGGVITRAINRFQQVLMTAFGATLGGGTGAVAGAVAGGALESFGSKRAARLLLNSDFTKWLRTTPTGTTPQVIERHLRRLDGIAARQPAIAADIIDFQRYLAESFARSPTKAAAAEEENN